MKLQLGLIGGWGWIRSGAESPTGSPSPAPSVSAAHASHARHDRSMVRWIFVSRAKLCGFGSSLRGAKKYAPSSGCLFVHFEQGGVIVFFVDMSKPTCKNTGLATFRSFEGGIIIVFFTSACAMLESPRNYKVLVNYN